MGDRPRAGRFRIAAIRAPRVVDIDNVGGNGEQLGKVRSAVASGSRDDLEALVVGSHKKGLNQAVVLDGFGTLVQLGFIEDTAGVGGGLVNGVDDGKLYWSPREFVTTFLPQMRAKP